jgi:hypothetical protein
MLEVWQSDLKSIQMEVCFAIKPEPEVKQAWLPDNICHIEYASNISCTLCCIQSTSGPWSWGAFGPQSASVPSSVMMTWPYFIRIS